MIHLSAAGGVLAVGLVLGLSRWELGLLILTVILVLQAELFNTALEFVLNLLERRGHPVVKAAKDIAAGAVLVTVLASIGMGLLLFGPRLLALLKQAAVR